MIGNKGYYDNDGGGVGEDDQHNLQKGVKSNLYSFFGGLE